MHRESEIAEYADRKEQGFMWHIRHSNDAEHGTPAGTGRRPERRRTVWAWIETLLLVFGLALLAFYALARIESILSSREALNKFEALSSSGAASSPEAGEDTDSSLVLGPSEVDFSQWDRHRVQAYKESFSDQSDVPLGVLRISKIHLEVPLFDGTDDLTLNHGVGRISGTAQIGEEGNIGIAGHRDGFFRGLKDVGAGDSIELRTLKGTDTYIVDRIQIVTPRDVDVLRPRSVPSLTLVTCYPFYFIGSAPQRYIVTAFLSRESKSGPGSSDTPAAILNTQFKKEKQ
jgi:sortase A